MFVLLCYCFAFFTYIRTAQMQSKQNVALSLMIISKPELNKQPVNQAIQSSTLKKPPTQEIVALTNKLVGGSGQTNQNSPGLKSNQDSKSKTYKQNDSKGNLKETAKNLQTAQASKKLVLL